MPAIAMAVVWGGYALSLYGYCLIKGYNVTLGQLVNPARFYNGPWPPLPISDGQFMPSGQSGDEGMNGTLSTAKAGGQPPAGPGSGQGPAAV